MSIRINHKGLKGRVSKQPIAEFVEEKREETERRALEHITAAEASGPKSVVDPEENVTPGEETISEDTVDLEENETQSGGPLPNGRVGPTEGATPDNPSTPKEIGDLEEPIINAENVAPSKTNSVKATAPPGDTQDQDEPSGAKGAVTLVKTAAPNEAVGQRETDATGGASAPKEIVVLENSITSVEITSEEIVKSAEAARPDEISTLEPTSTVDSSRQPAPEPAKSPSTVTSPSLSLPSTLAGSSHSSSKRKRSVSVPSSPAPPRQFKKVRWAPKVEASPDAEHLRMMSPAKEPGEGSLSPVKSDCELENEVDYDQEDLEG